MILNYMYGAVIPAKAVTPVILKQSCRLSR